MDKWVVFGGEKGRFVLFLKKDRKPSQNSLNKSKCDGILTLEFPRDLDEWDYPDSWSF